MSANRILLELFPALENAIFSSCSRPICTISRNSIHLFCSPTIYLVDSTMLITSSYLVYLHIVSGYIQYILNVRVVSSKIPRSILQNTKGHFLALYILVGIHYVCTFYEDETKTYLLKLSKSFVSVDERIQKYIRSCSLISVLQGTVRLLGKPTPDKHKDVKRVLGKQNRWNVKIFSRYMSTIELFHFSYLHFIIPLLKKIKTGLMVYVDTNFCVTYRSNALHEGYLINVGLFFYNQNIPTFFGGKKQVVQVQEP